MKICLVNPPANSGHPILPLGLAYLASVLEENGYKVIVIDAWAEGLTAEQVGIRFGREKPEIVGITMMTPRLEATMSVVNVARKVLMESLIIVGGHHPTALPEETLRNNKNIDIAVIGEGEDAILEIVETKENNGDLSNVKGICYRKGNEIIKTTPRSMIKDLDSLPPPARHLFPIDKYRTHPPYGRKNPYANVITSRGCPYRCGYCSKSVFGHSYRTLSPDRVIAEIEFLIKRYNIAEIHFYDDDFTMDMKRAEEICDIIIGKNLRFIWSCTTRVNLVTPKLLEKMKAAGCWMISYGVESGNQKILDRIEKGVTIEQVRNAFIWTRKSGIRTLGFFMVGLPGETWDTIKQTIKLAKEIKPDFTSWCVLIILPGTRLFDQIESGALDKSKIKAYSSQGYDLARSPYAHGVSLAYEDNLTVEELNKAVTSAYREFYLRPAYILNTLFRIRSVPELIHYTRGAWEMLSWVIKPTK